MEQKKTSEIVELNENELAGVSGGDGNNSLLYGVGGAALGAGAMAMFRKPKTIVQTVEKAVYVPHPGGPQDQKLLDNVGKVQNFKQAPNFTKPGSKESPI